MAPREESDGTDGRTLLIRNMGYSAKTEDVREMFSKWGEIRDVYLPLDYQTKEPRGFGFVEFTDVKDAEDAMENMQGTRIAGREVSIQIARHGRQRQRKGGESSGGGRGGKDRDKDKGKKDRDEERRSRSRRRKSSKSRSRSRSPSRSKSKSRD